jgi:hypothetical protein
MTFELVLIAQTHERDVSLFRQIFDEAQRKLLAVITDGLVPCVDGSRHENFFFVPALKVRP